MSIPLVHMWPRFRSRHFAKTTAIELAYNVYIRVVARSGEEATVSGRTPRCTMVRAVEIQRAVIPSPYEKAKESSDKCGSLRVVRGHDSFHPDEWCGTNCQPNEEGALGVACLQTLAPRY